MHYFLLTKKKSNLKFKADLVPVMFNSSIKHA